MALARLDIPGLAFYNGSIAPGRFQGRDVTIQDVYEAIGARAAGRMTDEEVHELESCACPGAGACGGQFTANTMATVIDFLGISPRGLSGIPATHPDKEQAAVEVGKMVMELVRSDTGPSSILTREAFENAIAAVAGTGGSTNGVLHLLAIAREAGVPLELEDFDTISAQTPIVADLKPFGRYVATDLQEAGGIGLVARELVGAGRIHAGERGVDGRTLGDVATAVEERPGQDVVLPYTAPVQPTRRDRDPPRLARARGLRRQARRPRAAAPLGPGARLRLRGGLLRGGQGPLDRAGRRRRDPLRGPVRRPGHARDAARHRARSSARASATRSP